jgi:hypothetical protein
MLTNTKMTIYNRYVDETTRELAYHRVVLDSVHWEDNIGRTQNQFGAESADNTKVTVPFTVSGATYIKPIAFQALSDKTGYFTLQKEDVAVKGEVTDAFEDLEGLEDVATITNVQTADYGSTSMRHWQLDCR